MAVVQVAIVGRPNVGKSSLFNWIARKRLAIVDDMAGVTRDRLSFLISHDDAYFELIDTGGIGFEDVGDITEQVDAQINVSIGAADIVLFVVDTREGIMALDQHVADRLRRSGVTVICVANKADHAGLDNQSAEFYRLGYGDPVVVSTKQNRGQSELIERIAELVPAVADVPDDAQREAPLKIAIVGRRNVGKSTFVNSLAQSERMITSEIPGTTRDAVDVQFELDGKSFIAIDTPGLLRAKAFTNNVDFYSMHRAHRSIRRADFVLLFFDAAEPIGRLDKQLCEYIHEHHKPCIFVVNKWDLYAGKVMTEEWAEYLADTFPMMRHVPVAFVTGKTGKNAKTLLNHAQMLYKQASCRVSTGELNRVVGQILDQHPPPRKIHRRPKVFYAAQIAVCPPTIVLFCSDPTAFVETYRRYFVSALRDRLPYEEVPIRVIYRKRESHTPRDRAERVPSLGEGEPIHLRHD